MPLKTQSNLSQDEFVIPGVFLVVNDVGLLLTGSSQSGKSTLALHLLHRGHCLVADDAPVFQQGSGQTLIGHCPSPLQDFLCVPPLGVLNIRKLLGANHLHAAKKLSLIIELSAQENNKTTLALVPQFITTEHHSIPITTLSLSPYQYSDWPLLVEYAAAQYTLQQQGYNSYQAFIEAQPSLENTATENSYEN